MTHTRTVTVEERACEAMINREVVVVSGAGRSAGVHMPARIMGVQEKGDQFYMVIKSAENFDHPNCASIGVHIEPGVLIQPLPERLVSRYGRA